MHRQGAQEEDEFEYIEATVDSGAADSVMGKAKAKRCKLRPSEGSKKGVRYIAAAGAAIYNEGEKHVKVMTEEGNTCNLNMQITAVNKALLSVSKTCDIGHKQYSRKQEV